MIFGRVNSHSLSLKVLQIKVEVVVACLHSKLLAVFITIIVSTIDRVSKVKLLDCVDIILESEAQCSYIPSLTKLDSSETEVLLGAGSSRIEEIYLVDVYLVVYSIYKIGAYGFLKVCKRFQVRYFPKPEHIVVEELDSTGWPSIETCDPNPYSFGVYSCEVNSSQVCLDRLGNFEGCFHFDKLFTIN